MDHDSLTPFLRRLALASVPLVSSACFNPCPDAATHDKVVTLASLGLDAGAVDGGAMGAGGADGGLDELCRLAIAGPGNVQRCELVKTKDGQPAVHVVYMDVCVGGRRPAGYADLVPAGASALGAWLARMASLEAASVDAFEILAGELDAHGAPRALSRAARAAADDERRHARVMTRLARGEGTRPVLARVTRRPPRELEAVARENAVEGCVRETFGALLAWRQSTAAAAPGLRAAMRLIAPDETRHAALALAIDEWAHQRMPAAARRRVDEARAQAVADLTRDAGRGEPVELRGPAGLPDGPAARALAEALFERVGPRAATDPRAS